MTRSDSLVNAIGVTTINESSIEFEYQCRRTDNDAVLVDGAVTHVMVDETGKSTRVPTAFREAVVAFQHNPPEHA